jgi:DNA-binding MarR family transcriptional regulator
MITTVPSIVQERSSSPGLLLAVLGQRAMRELRAVHTEVGLTPRQFQLLGLLHDRGALSQRELGETMGIDPSILVTMLNPLEDEGTVRRERDRNDRRRHTVTLTAAGTRKLERAAAAQRAAEDSLLAGLDPAQREQLCELLLQLRDAVAGDC